MIDEAYPFAAYHEAVEAAVAGRGRVIVKVVCALCESPVAAVYDSPHGAVFCAEMPATSQAWSLEGAAPGTPYPTITSNDLIEWDDDRPVRSVTAGCRDHGVVVVIDPTPKVAQYRRTSKVQRLPSSPRSSA